MIMLGPTVAFREIVTRIYIVTILLFACVGCSTQAFPPAPASVAMSDYRYLIGPGDVLNVIVWRNPELSMVVQVPPDGKLMAPLVENMNVTGKNASDVAREMEKALSKFIREPVVTVVVTNFVGPYSEQIRIVGEAVNPQVLSYREKMTLLDVMIAVGGITDFADGNRATILRTAEGNKQYSVRLRDLLRRGDVSANVEMRAGDILIIPQSWF